MFPLFFDRNLNQSTQQLLDRTKKCVIITYQYLISSTDPVVMKLRNSFSDDSCLNAKTHTNAPFRVCQDLCRDVSVLRIYPSIKPETVIEFRSILSNC